MKICILGNTTGNIDEGMKKITFNIARELSKNHDILTLNPLEVFSWDFWRAIKNFKPQIIHYIPGPSIKSFILVKTLSIYLKDAKTIISATHPGFYGIRGFSYGLSYALSSILKNFVPLLKPDLILTQSYDSEEMFKSMGCKTEFLPNGVRADKFVPVSADIKERLREKYRIDKRKFVLLHVGPIKRERNIQIFKKLQGHGNQVIIAGSTSTGMEDDLIQELRDQGCLIWTGYHQNIEDVYALSDCFVFPAMIGMSSIELPLSVMEAMSCNLPVISTRFGALNRAFPGEDGLIFVDKEDDFLQGIEKIKNGNIEIRTREKVLLYSWENIVKRLEETYERVLYEL
ncbi:MAG: glycosyltransferase family 4 protein [Halobacteriota archaeon]